MRSPTSKGAPEPNCSFAPPPERLRRAALTLPTRELAAFLIGKLLVRRLDDGAALIGRIVETEAYEPNDPASHAFRGPTKRNRSMFAPHAHAYVYLIYGTAYCLNVSAEPEGIGAAVLVRAAEPLGGCDRMRVLRGRAGLRAFELARGPGNLCRAFAIGPECDGLDLDTDPRLAIADDGVRPAMGTSRRIGITKAVEHEWRFYARGSAAVSGPRSLSP